MFVVNGNPTIDDNTIIRNRVANGGHGGGIVISDVGPGALLTDNVIVKNEAPDGYGGGLYYIDNSVPAVQVTLFHNTFADNTIAHSLASPITYGQGNSVYLEGTMLMTFSNSIIRGPRLPSDFNGLPLRCSISTPIPNVQYSCIGPVISFFPLPAQWNVVPGTNVTNNKPEFVNIAADNYHLSAISPCIDMALSALPGITATDVDGDQRFTVLGAPAHGAAVDMGADERL
jgi:hypothetical protein